MKPIQKKLGAAGGGWRGGTRRPVRVLAAVLAAGLVATACNTSNLLTVDTPASVPVKMIDDPKNAALMVSSVRGDFECALGSAIAVEGIISDELADAQLGAAAWPYDRRDANTQTNGAYGTRACTDNQTPGIYTPLATARWAADHALKSLNGWTDAQVSGRQALIAQSALYAGFSYALMGMSMCSAAFDLGPEVNQPAMFALAEQRFTTAIAAAQASGQTNLVNAAYVGRARVRLFQGNKQGAIADAQLVPKGFRLATSNDATDNRLYNRLFTITAQNGFYTVEASARNMTTENGEVDPRSATTLTSTRPADAKSPIYVANKYAAGYTAPTRIASYEEAQLIIAEAQGGQPAVSIINAMRADVGLKPYAGPTDAASVLSLVLSERRRALFLEGFRNYDQERYNLAFDPPVGSAYPLKGGTYGNTRCLPLPDVERFNNPNIKSS